jgi:hypothetical protein
MTFAKLIPVAFAAAVLASAIPSAAAADAKGEAQLAKLLDGRVPGAPVHCLSRTQRDNMQVIDRTALVFRDGKTLYVNRPGGVNFLTWTDVPVFKIWGDQLCSKDLVHLRDRSSGIGGPSMIMGDFIPYRRAG